MDELKTAPCPICGKQAFVMHNTIPEADDDAFEELKERRRRNG